MKLIKFIHGAIAGIMPGYAIYKLLAFFLSTGKDNTSWTTGISIPLAIAILFWLLFILYSVFKKENVKSIWRMSLISSGGLCLIVFVLSLITKESGPNIITTSIQMQKDVGLKTVKSLASMSFTTTKEMIILGIYGILALITGYKIK